MIHGRRRWRAREDGSAAASCVRLAGRNSSDPPSPRDQWPGPVATSFQFGSRLRRFVGERPHIHHVDHAISAAFDDIAGAVAGRRDQFRSETHRDLGCGAAQLGILDSSPCRSTPQSSRPFRRAPRAAKSRPRNCPEPRWRAAIAKSPDRRRRRPRRSFHRPSSHRRENVRDRIAGSAAAIASRPSHTLELGSA